MLHRAQDTVVNLRFVGLAEPHNQNAVVRFASTLGEAFVGGDEQPPFVEHSRPKNVVIHPLIRRAANVENVMAETAKFLNRAAGDVLVHENLHSVPMASNGVTSSSAREAAQSKQARMSSGCRVG